MTLIAESPPESLARRADALRAGYRDARARGGGRHREIAAALGAAEGELIAAHVDATRDGLSARRLQRRWPALLAGLRDVGPVMALTRNAACVHEKVGRYEDVQAEGDDPAMGLVLGPDIDLRLFFRRWAHAFAVEERFPDPARPAQTSLQVFDAAGVAVHKVFARDGTDASAWQALVGRLADDDQSPGLGPRAVAPAAIPRPDETVDVAAFRRDWTALRDTHEFFGMLRRHGLARTQALRLADPRYALAVDPRGTVHELLRGAATSGTPIMVFVGNPGVIQIHTGPVKRVETIGPWVNVLDPGFNLHLRDDLVHEAWLVRKPTADGLVTSLELFDAAGETIAMVFGERKPGRPELCAWRRLAAGLARDAAWAKEDDPCTAC